MLVESHSCGSNNTFSTHWARIINDQQTFSDTLIHARHTFTYQNQYIKISIKWQIFVSMFSSRSRRCTSCCCCCAKPALRLPKATNRLNDQRVLVYLSALNGKPTMNTHPLGINVYPIHACIQSYNAIQAAYMHAYISCLFIHSVLYIQNHCACSFFCAAGTAWHSDVCRCAADQIDIECCVAACVRVCVCGSSAAGPLHLTEWVNTEHSGTEKLITNANVQRCLVPLIWTQRFWFDWMCAARAVSVVYNMYVYIDWCGVPILWNSLSTANSTCRISFHSELYLLVHAIITNIMGIFVSIETKF